MKHLKPYKLFESLEERVSFFQSRDINEFRPIFRSLVGDFGYTYYDTILEWCGIIKDENPPFFWEVYLIKLDDKTVGICGLYSLKQSTDELWLGWFGVIPELRSKGIGRNVIDFLKTKAREQNCKAIYSYVDKNGAPLKFYYREGFKLIGTVQEYVNSHDDVSIESFEDPNDFVIKLDL